MFVRVPSNALLGKRETLEAPSDNPIVGATTPEGGPLLEVRDLRKLFPVHRGLLSRVVARVHAVDGVSFAVGRGETLGLVGESGCGKTTTGRVLLRLLDPTSGEVTFDGLDVFALGRTELRALRGRMQIIFQDPFSSLNPRMSVASIVGEGLVVHGVGTAQSRRERVAEVLERVGLGEEALSRYPHEFSGGQRQRIGIARALALDPEFIVCDEAVSALDVSIQAQIINLLEELQAELGISYLFIAHDLSVVRHISHKVAVMYVGQIVESAETEALFEDPRHPYTRALLSAVPVPDPKRRRKRIVLEGDVPSPIDPPSYCRFYDRGCPKRMDVCRQREPSLLDDGAGHACACFAVNPG